MIFFSWILCVLLLIRSSAFDGLDALSCSLDGREDEIDPALHEMKFDFGDGPETFLAYVQPDVTTFYRDIDPPSSKAVNPKFKGFAGMFVNMSNKPVRLYWETHVGGTRSLMEIQNPFSAGGTATFPGHSFFYTPEDDVDNILIRFSVQSYPENIYTYDPFFVEGDEEQTQKNLSLLDEEDLKQYLEIRKSYLFSQEYKKFTGRSYLAHYPRARPPHFMWRADYFNQTHWVTTRETKFQQVPPPEQLSPIQQHGKVRAIADTDPRPLGEYRESGVLNMTLKVLSCAPRVFEIADFLSDVEVQHILELAAAEQLGLSLTGNGETDDEDDGADIRQTRTSYNSWLERERSPIIDAIYRRASDLLRIDEALLRYRGDGEYPHMPNNNTIAESLQLVHYDPGQEYTAHHDFGFSDFDDEFQVQRFATLLLYLNEGMTGGATSFPRWVNAETFEELKVLPEIGKAVLFYSQLPDGNMDDFSHHEAKKIINGEKWLINLWVWGPHYS